MPLLIQSTKTLTIMPNTRVSEQSVMSNIKKDLNDWGITQQNAKDLYNYLNGN